MPGGGSIGHPGDIFIGNDEGPGSVRKWFFALGGGYLNFHINSPSIGARFFPLAPFSPAVGQWYHVAVTKSGTTYTLFINGTLAAKATDTNPVPNANAPLTIGQAENLGFMSGKLDEITIYGRSLAQEEVKLIYDAGSAGKCSNLSVRPNHGGNAGLITTYITGSGFAQNATATLVKNGWPDIMGSTLSVDGNGTSMNVAFDLSGKDLGEWDLVITNPDNKIFNLPNGFTIEKSTAPQLWLDITGFPVYRAGNESSYWISFGNNGNVDVPSSTLVLSLPTGLRRCNKIKLSFSERFDKLSAWTMPRSKNVLKNSIRISTNGYVA